MSQVKLYKNSKIIPERNFKVDSIEDYLTSLDVLTFDDVQYLKLQQIEFDVKLDVSQLYLDYNSLYSYNYARIVEGDLTKVLYYFITKKEWKSKSTIAIHLVLDTINSFEIGTNYNISNRTKVLREHKDRFADIVDGRERVTIVNYSNPSYDYDPDDPILHTGFLQSEFPSDFIALSTSAERISWLSSHNMKIRVKYNIGRLRPRYHEFEASEISSISVSVSTPYYYIIDLIPTSTMISNYPNVLYGTQSPLSYDGDAVIEATRKIDVYSEGLTPVLFKYTRARLVDSLDVGWNLAYISSKILSEEDNNVVEAQLIPDDTLTMDVALTTQIITPSMLESGKTYYIVQDAGISGDFEIKTKFPNNDDINVWTHLSASQAGEWRYVAIQKVDASNLKAIYLQYTKYETRILHTIGEVTGSQIEILTLLPNGLLYTAEQTGSAYLSIDLIKSGMAGGTIVDKSFSFTSAEVTLKSIQEYDRTQSTLIKIIKLPYAPSDYTYDEDNGKFAMTSTWQYSNNLFVLGDFNAKFNHKVETNTRNPIKKDLFIDIPSSDVSLSKLRDDKYESKLYHSDFYQIKFVYDSFSYGYQLEAISIDDVSKGDFDDYFSFRFIPTTTINSKFLFDLTQDGAIVLNRSVSDFDLYLPVARNNEMPIYNSTYLNYLRTAYNYDLKAKERTIKTGALGLGLGLVGSVAGAGLGIASGNPAVAISSVLNATSSMTTGIVNYLNQVASQEEQLESKMASLQAQSVSVSGSDDVDLMEYYSENRAWLITYKVSSRMEKALADLFYYTGYATNEMKIPSFATRIWFNFVAMEVDISENITNLSEDILADISQRWANGVTILHKRNNTWNFAQTLENWEVSIYE